MTTLSPILKKVAVAIFVKTPGQSPLKTRLAKTIGEKDAHKFYLLACETITSTLKKSNELTKGVVHPVWAVAESHCFSEWSHFPHVHQGEGTLGEKLHHVYSSLLASYDGVMLIGADAPHIEVDCFSDVLARHEDGAAFVAGPASDGGFYLFSGTVPIPKEVWTETTYSSADTLKQLLPKIETLGRTEMLQTRTDVDVFTDLATMLAESEGLRTCPAYQKELFQFVSDLVAKYK